MNAAAIFESAEAAGVTLAAEAGALVVRFDRKRPPPSELVEAIRANKPALLAALEKGGSAQWGADSCHPIKDRRAALVRFTERFHEIAGFAISDGATRAEADRLALVRIAAELRAKSPTTPSASSACAHCGAEGELRPHLAAGGHVWLHASCWPAYDTARAEQALARACWLLAEAKAAGLTDAEVAL